MRFLSNEKKSLLAYLGSKALELSFVEQAIPTVVPFFRLGLANSVILSSMELEFPLFVLLCLLKSAVISTMSGTLLSPFFAVSICQSVCSGAAMYLVARLSLNSVFGLSLLGASVSAVVQLALCSIYMGQNLMTLAGPMLLFSAASAAVTAVISLRIKKELGDRKEHAELKVDDSLSHDESHAYGRRQKMLAAACAIAILIFTVVIFLVRNIYILLAFLGISLVLQIVSGRKVRVLPHVFMWIFVIGSPYIVSGNVALAENVCRAVRLSATMCLSQSATRLRFPPDSLIGMTLANFNRERARKTK